MSMDQIEGLEPIHENWGDVDLGELATSVPWHPVSQCPANTAGCFHMLGK